MVDNLQFDEYTPREAVENAAHEIRSRQLNILSLVQLMQKIESGEVDSDTLNSPLSMTTGFESIQQSVNEISELLDNLVDYMRDYENI